MKPTTEYSSKARTGCITLTFGDCAENHVGMQKIGTLSSNGFTRKDLDTFAEIVAPKPTPLAEIELWKLPLTPKKDEILLVEPDVCTDAYVLIIRGGCRLFVDPDRLQRELKNLDWDKKAKMRGRVVNKLARYNLCFGEESQEPDYENGKGRIYAYNDLKYLNKLKKGIDKTFVEDLQCEGNLYYDIERCGIGFHGDSERRKVIAIRLGETIPLVYQWFYKGNPVGEPIKFDIHHGDIYIMSEKAVGTDWKKRNTPTLRHAAGSKKYLQTQHKPSTGAKLGGKVTPLEKYTVAELKKYISDHKILLPLKGSGAKGRILKQDLIDAIRKE
jgi:hypothetical protein